MRFKLLIAPLLASAGATLVTVSIYMDEFFALTSIQQVCFLWFVFMNAMFLMCMMDYLTKD